MIMKTVRAISLLSLLAAAAAHAQPLDTSTKAPCDDPCKKDDAETTAAQPKVAAIQPADTATQPSKVVDDEGGWHAPPGKRFVSGFRLGWMYIGNIYSQTRMADSNGNTTLASQFGLKSANMFLLGYEGFYRIVGHSWLNVLMVGNVSVAGLDQSKFIPAVSGLLGFEFDRSFQVGVGVNLVPDPQAPSHMIIAAGWTPTIGSIQTPLHGFYIPDPSGNYRVGATVGMNW
jgi:hypothetical protein